MRISHIFAAGLLAVAAGAVTGAGPAMAADDEINTAVASDGPTGTYYCNDDLDLNYIAGARVCFKPYGDAWYVKDTAADSASAVATWGYSKPGDQPQYFSRTGECRNKLGYGKWGVCNKDYVESGTVYFRAMVFDYSANTFIRQSISETVAPCS